MRIGRGLGLQMRQRLIKAAKVRWILNADLVPAVGYLYVWKDTEIWDDTHIWKD